LVRGSQSVTSAEQAQTDDPLSGAKVSLTFWKCAATLLAVLGEAPMITTDLLQGTLDLSDAVASALGAAQANL
jgi:hypothetical protein